MDNKEMEKLSTKELDQVAGGRRRDAGLGPRCQHEHKIRTGNEKEDSFFIFWSRHKYEYHCQDCEQNIWLTE